MEISDLSKIKNELINKINEIDTDSKIDIHIYCNNNLGGDVFHSIDEVFNKESDSLSFDFEDTNEDFKNLLSSFDNINDEFLEQIKDKKYLHICIFDKEKISGDMPPTIYVESNNSNNNIEFIKLGGGSPKNVSFLLYPQTFANNTEDIVKWDNRIKNILNDISLFLKDNETMKIPETTLTSDFELFKSTCNRRGGKSPLDYTNPILFNNISLKSDTSLYSSKEKNANFYILIQNFFNNPEFIKLFILYIIVSSKRKYRKLYKKVCTKQSNKLDFEPSTRTLFDMNSLQNLKILLDTNQKDYTVKLVKNNEEIPNANIKEGLENIIKECNSINERFLIIRLSISNVHANFIIIDLKNSVAVRIEPHGFNNKTFYNQEKADNLLRTSIFDELFIDGKKIFYVNGRINVGKTYENALASYSISIQTDQGICWVVSLMMIIMTILYPKFTPMTLNRILSKDQKTTYNNFEMMFFRLYEFMKIIKLKISINLDFNDAYISNDKELIESSLSNILVSDKYNSLLWHKVNSSAIEDIKEPLFNFLDSPANFLSEFIFYISMTNLIYNGNIENNIVISGGIGEKNLYSFTIKIDGIDKTFTFSSNISMIVGLPEGQEFKNANITCEIYSDGDKKKGKCFQKDYVEIPEEPFKSNAGIIESIKSNIKSRKQNTNSRGGGNYKKSKKNKRKRNVSKKLKRNRRNRSKKLYK